MRRCVFLLAAGGALVLSAALVYRAVCPAPLPTPVKVAPEGNAAGQADEAAWRYRLCQPRHWRYMLLNK
jgi:hypothetical protein